jgi:hypothetical protein
VADDELGAVGGKLVGDRHAFLGVGAVVADGDHELLAENAAGRIDVLHGLLDALLELGAEGGAAPGNRPADRDLHVGQRRRRRGERKACRQSERYTDSCPHTSGLHCHSPIRLPVFETNVLPTTSSNNFLPPSLEQGGNAARRIAALAYQVSLPG